MEASERNNPYYSVFYITFPTPTDFPRRAYYTGSIPYSHYFFLFQRVIIGVLLAFVVAIAELYFMARVEI